MQAGGAERVVLSLVDGARAAGLEVAVAAAPGALDHRLDCIRFDLPLIGRRPLGVGSAAWKLRKAVRDWDPDVLHCHNPGMAITAALVTRRGTRPPGLVSVHGVPDEDYASAGRVLRLAGLPIVACGPGVAAALRAYGVPIQATVLNGVSPPPPPADRRSLASGWGFPDELRIAVSVGRLVPQKNHSLALRAIARLPDVGLVVVGEGPLRHTLEQLAQELQIGRRVVFAGARADARAIMGAADAVLITSCWEGLPLVALETLVGGTPLIATAVRGVQELLRHEDQCLLVPPDDPAAVAAALVRVLTDGELRRRISSQGRTFAGTFTEEAMVSSYLRLYQQLNGSEGSSVRSPACPP
jgi:glycosyltransferase involved in cell wall biosynthesis